MLIGTTVNALTIVAGSLIGLLLSRLLARHKRLSALPDAMMKAISVFVVFIGIKGALESQKSLVVILSLLIGTVIGTLIDIDSLLERLGNKIEKRFTRYQPVDESGEGTKKSISKAFVSTTLTCCVGALAITGALESGLSHGVERELLYTKSVLDFITAFVFSSSFGIGAIFSAIVVFVYQGVIELCAFAISDTLSYSINEISATGSLIVAALGLNMLGATKVKVANMLPAVFLPILLCLFL